MSATWPQLWLPVVGFAHLFALYWLIRAVRLLRLAWYLRCSALIARWWHACSRQKGGQLHADPGQAAAGQPAVLVRRAASIHHHHTTKLPAVERKAVLAWHGVGCSYRAAGSQHKTVLQGAMGLVRTGEMTGLLGPSGSGKSTLLEILAGRKTVGLLTGRVGLLPSQPIKLQPAAHHQEPASHDAAPDTAPADGHTVAAALPGTGAQPGPQPPSPVLEDSGLVPSKSAEAWQLSSGDQAEAHALVWRDVRAHAAAVKHVSWFFPQDIVFPPSLTALEVMQVQASLLGLNNPAAQVASALASVGLANHASTLVGGPLSGGLVLQGLSGGERKRLAVAAGLLAAPSLLILDEPTTGLDAASAASLMALLSTMCDQQGVSVVCSLHQPRAAIWNQLHVVVVLSGGHCLYSGPKEGVLPWMSHLDYTYIPLRHGSPPDWIMDLVNVSFVKSKRYFSRTMRDADDLAQAAAAFSQYWVSTHPALESDHTDTHPTPPNTPLTSAHTSGNSTQGVLRRCITAMRRSVGLSAPDPAQHTAAAGDGGRPVAVLDRDARPHDMQRIHHAGWLRQVAVLAWREATLQSRNPADLACRVLVFCWAAVVVGAVFFGLNYDIQGLQYRTIVSYVEVIILFLLPFVYMSLYVADRRIFISELVSGLYHPTAYYCAKSLLLVLSGSLNAIIFSLIVYGMVGFTHMAVPMVAHVLITCLGYLVAQQVLYCAATISPNQDVAFMLAIVWTALNILLANYPMRLVEYTMQWVKPLRFISAMYHSFSGLLAVEFTHSPTYSCAGGLGASVVNLLPEYLPKTPAVRLPAIQSLLLSPGPDCVLNPQSVLDYFGVSLNWWVYALLLVGYLLLTHAASLAALLWVARRELR